MGVIIKNFFSFLGIHGRNEEKEEIRYMLRELEFSEKEIDMYFKVHMF